MKVLVTGATGFIGRHVVARLLADGHAVRALTRRAGSASARSLAAAGADLIVADLRDANALRDAAGGVEAVVHLVGIISEAGRETFDEVHVETTRRMLNAARAAGADRWVHMSALGTRPGAVSRYHRTKWVAEELVRSSGLRWTIFRPSIVLGPGSGFEKTFLGIARWSPVVPVVGDGKNLLQPVGVETVAAAFSKALTAPESIGRTLDLCGPRRLTLVETVALVLEKAGKRRLPVHIPEGLARFQAGVMETILSNRLVARPSPLTRDQLLMLREDNVADMGPTEVVLGGLEH